mmetsp:Transcript_2533/g.8383  ORF Transcript_2533/g.8383 Transcript_2533/m.8383 type:complete len:228 (+) Transcript_2533:18-701(+)
MTRWITTTSATIIALASYYEPGATLRGFFKNCKLPGTKSSNCSSGNVINGSKASPYASSNGCSAHSICSFFNFGYKRLKFSINTSARCAKHTRARLTDAFLSPAEGVCSVPTPFHTKFIGPTFFAMMFTLKGSWPSTFSSAGNPARRSTSALAFAATSSSVGSGPNSFKNAPPFLARAHTKRARLHALVARASAGRVAGDARDVEQSVADMVVRGDGARWVGVDARR